MSFRAVYIIPATPNAEVPVFTRLFPTVEVRYKSLSGQCYVNIPSEKEFVELLLNEIRLKNADVFNEEHDRCDKEHLNPAFQVKTVHGDLWPVIVMKRRRFIYAAISFEENFSINKQSNAKFMIMSSVASVLEVLNGLAYYVEKYNLLQSPSSNVELLKYFRSALPYGRPVCCDPSVALNFPAAFWKGKVKQPAWNPVLPKGKSYVMICIREELRGIQFNSSEATDQLQVEGVISCSSELEGAAPEISLVLSNTTNCNILVNPCVSNIETITSSTKLRFHAVKSQSICLYEVCASVHQPPLLGSFTMKVNEGHATVNVHLRLQPKIKNGFQKLEVHVPFMNDISSVKSQCSQGSISVQSMNTLVWNVGSKLPSKTLSASLETRAKLKLKKTNNDFYDQSDTKIPHDCLFPEPFTLIKYATVVFTSVDYVYSGMKIDPTSILVTSSSKGNRAVGENCKIQIY